MKKELLNEDGMALVAVLMILLLMGFIGMGLVDATTSEVKISRNEKIRLDAFYAAERGLEYSRTDTNIYATIGEGTVNTPLAGVSLAVGDSDASGTVQWLYTSSKAPTGSGNAIQDDAATQASYYLINVTGANIRDSRVTLQSNQARILPR